MFKALTTWFENFMRGGEVLLHELSMFRSKVVWLIAAGVLPFVLVFAGTARVLTGDAWPLYWRYNVARLADLCFLGWTRMLAVKGRLPTEFVREFGGAYHQAFWFTSAIAVVLSVAVFIAVGYAVQRAFVARGMSFTDVFLRGTQIQTKAELVAKVEATWTAARTKWAEAAEQASANSTPPPRPLPPMYTFAGVPLPPRMAQRNILATGGMGSGKSVAIFDLADQVAAAGKTMVVYDKVTEFARYYYREGQDVIFNPFDSRFPGWNIFSEISQIYEFDQIATYLIPSGEKASGTEDYFLEGARTVLACVMQRLWEEGRTNPSRRTNEALCKAIFETGQETLYEWLKGTPAEALLNPESKGTGGGGFLTTLTKAVKVLRYVPSGPFSLKQFIRAGGDRRIFITSKEEVHEILKPLTAMAMCILYTTVMSGVEVPDDRTWFFMDELKSIGKLPVFATAVTEARKYGAVAVVGVQNVAQFEEMFGKESAKTIRSNLQNYLILRVSDEETQESYSKLIGVGEFDELSDSKSWGAAESKDGASVSISRKERRAVLASEIKLLPDCAGFLQLAGNFDIARVDYVPHGRPEIASGWMPRDDLALEQAPAPASAIAVTEWDDPTADGDAQDSVFSDQEEQVEVEDSMVVAAVIAEAEKAEPPRKKRQLL